MENFLLVEKLRNFNESSTISNKELFKIVKQSSSIKKLLSANNYCSDLIDVWMNDWEDPPRFDDSYVDSPDDFMKYCICKFLKIDSGIDSSKAIKDIEKNADLGASRYRNYYCNYTRYRFKNKEAEKLIKKGIEPKTIMIRADDDGDELANPLQFVKDSIEFAKLCNANEIANKLKSNSKVKKAIELDKLIVNYSYKDEYDKNKNPYYKPEKIKNRSLKLFSDEEYDEFLKSIKKEII